ncbi:MAG: hypothetical protein HZB38_14210 [Planctomycetes bacterium]|nr:hypothetical protein [Planctomycetota bacterium]
MRTCLLVLIAIALISPAPFAAAQCDEGWLPGPPLSAFDGPSRAMTLWDPDGAGQQAEWLVVGGRFSTAREIPALSIAAWDGIRWHSFGRGLAIDQSDYLYGGIHALTVFDGRLVAAGDIVASDDRPLNHIAFWDGRSWQPLGEGLDDRVRALTVHGGVLIAAGDFTYSGETPISRVAGWDGARWHALGDGIGEGEVEALAVYGGELVAGGHFTTAGGVPADSIAVWNGADWRPLGTGVAGGSDAAIHAMAVLDGALIVGGTFSSAGGRVASNLAEWDGQEWRPIYSEMSREVRSLEVVDGQLVASGRIASQYLNPSSIMRLERGAWVQIGPSGSMPANDLIQYRGRLFACGWLGDPFPSSIVQWDASQYSPQWRVLGREPDLHRPLRAMIEFNGELIGSTLFTRTYQTPSLVVRWDGRQWTSFGSSPGVVSRGVIRDFAVYRNALFAGGSMSSNGVSVDFGLAQLYGTQWLPVPGATSGVSALCVYHDELLIGGWGLSRWDGMTMRLVEPRPEDRIFAMTVFRDELIVGGEFQATSDGQELRYIGAWNGSQWHSLGTGMEFRVWALTVYNDRLIAGGEFLSAGDVYAAGIAQWDGENWDRVGDVDIGYAYKLANYHGELIAAGDISKAYGAPSAGIARWDGQEWHALDEGIQENSIGQGTGSLAVHDDRLFVSGAFIRAGGRVSAYWGRWGPSLPGDLNGDDRVDLIDLYGLLQGFGREVDAVYSDGDFDIDGDVDISDLAALLGSFGMTCP